MQTSSDEFHSQRAAKLRRKTPAPTAAKEPIYFRLSPLILIGEKNSLKSPSSPTQNQASPPRLGSPPAMPL